MGDVVDFNEARRNLKSAAPLKFPIGGEKVISLPGRQEIVRAENIEDFVRRSHGATFFAFLRDPLRENEAVRRSIPGFSFAGDLYGVEKDPKYSGVLNVRSLRYLSFEQRVEFEWIDHLQIRPSEIAQQFLDVFESPSQMDHPSWRFRFKGKTYAVNVILFDSENRRIPKEYCLSGAVPDAFILSEFLRYQRESFGIPEQ